ncbi:MAG: hypothetical protein GY827_07770 [Cytophagales bacterium]|nr:hypothetical protein [Cytophagales bacterium]
MEWLKVVDFFIDLTGKKPADINNVLYTIGIQELGKGVQDFSKEEKQDLIHIGTCAVLTEYYRETHKDEDSWPHFEQIKEIPFLDLKEQVAFLRHHIIQYFYENDLIQ